MGVLSVVKRRVEQSFIQIRLQCSVEKSLVIMWMPNPQGNNLSWTPGLNNVRFMVLRYTVKHGCWLCGDSCWLCGDSCWLGGDSCWLGGDSWPGHTGSLPTGQVYSGQCSTVSLDTWLPEWLKVYIAIKTFNYYTSVKCKFWYSCLLGCDTIYWTPNYCTYVHCTQNTS